MVGLNKRRLGQDVVDKVEARFPQSDLHLLLAGRFASKIDKTPENGPTAVHMYPGRYSPDSELRIHSSKQMLEGEQLMFIPHRERLGQVHLRFYSSPPDYENNSLTPPVGSQDWPEIITY